jgi:glycosyltransferase involved in cell wall biosynthesis
VFCGAVGIPACGPSGASAHLRGVGRALVRAGHEVRIATPHLYDHRGPFDTPLGVPHVPHSPRSWRWLGPLRERGEALDSRRLARRATQDWTPDLIWERHALFCDGARRLAARGGIPRLVELNAPLAQERERYGRIRDIGYAHRMERKSLISADRVIAVSAWLTAWARDLGCAETRHVPNGVDTHLGDREAGRRDLRGLVIGFVGTHKPWHGIERIPAILDALPTATALLVGQGPVEVPRHPRLVSRGRLSPNELPDAIAAMDVGLVPYANDAPPWFCPLKILQYRAQGVPIVASDVGDCRALIGNHGEIVAGDAPQHWADAIRRQAETPRIPHQRTWDEVVAEALDGLGC